MKTCGGLSSARLGVLQFTVRDKDRFTEIKGRYSERGNVVINCVHFVIGSL